MGERHAFYRFKVNLTTAVILMFLAGGLLLANMRERHVIVDASVEPPVFNSEWGWPMAYKIHEAERPQRHPGYFSVACGSGSNSPPSPPDPGTAITCNIGVALAILLAVALLFEQSFDYRKTATKRKINS